MLEEAAAATPAVALARGVAAARGHHVAALGLDVEPGAELAVAAAEGLAGGAEVEVAAAAAGLCLHRRRQRPELGLQAGERLVAAVPWVDVDDDHAGSAAGRDADVGGRPIGPPARDHVPVGRGRVNTARGARMLARALTGVTAAAAADAALGAVDGENAQPLFGVTARPLGGGEDSLGIGDARSSLVVRAHRNSTGKSA